VPDEFDLPLSVVFQLAQFKKQLKFIYEELAKLGKHEAKVSPVLTGQYANRSFATMGRRTSGSSDAAKEVEIHERDLALLVERAKKKKEAKEADKAALKIEERYFEQLAKTASAEDARAQRERERQEKALQKERERNELIARRASLSGDVNYKSNAEIRYLKQQAEIERRRSKYQRKYGDLQTEFGTTDVSKIDKEIERRKKLDQIQKDNIASQKRLAVEQVKGVQSQQKLNKALDTAIGKLIRYRVAFAAMYKVYEGFTQSIKTFIDVNYQLAQIEKTIRPTKNALDDIKNTAFDLSKQYSIAIGDILDAFRIWGQTGLRQKELIDAVNASLIASNALGIDAKTITEDLTAAIYSYDVAAEDLVSVIDKWMAVQREYPVTAEDLANGMKKVGIAAKNLGIDMDELNGYLASIVAVTRKSGAEVGNSLKTIFARLPRDLTIEAFESVGVFTKKSENEFRDFSVVLGELAAKWKDLTDVEQRNIAQQAAGVRRYVDFLALMENYSVALSAAATSQDSFGEALQASATEVSTVRKQIQQLKNIYSEIGEAFGGELFPIINSFIGALKLLAKALSNSSIIKGIAAFSLFAGVIATAKASILAFQFVWDRLRTGLLFSIPSIETATLAFGTMGMKMKEAAIAANVLRSSLIRMRTANIIIFALSAMVSLWYVFRDATDSATESFEKFNRSLGDATTDIVGLKKSISAQSKQLEAIRMIAEERKKLLEILGSSEKGTEKYNRALKALTDRETALANKSEDVSNVLAVYGKNASLAAESSDEVTDAIQRLIDKQKDLIEQTNKEFERAKKLFLLDRDPEEYEKELRAQQDALDEALDAYSNYVGTASKILGGTDFKELFTGVFTDVFKGDDAKRFIFSDVGKFVDQVTNKFKDSLTTKKIELSEFINSESFDKLTPEQQVSIKQYYEDLNKLISELSVDIAKRMHKVFPSGGILGGVFTTDDLDKIKKELDSVGEELNVLYNRAQFGGPIYDEATKGQAGLRIYGNEINELLKKLLYLKSATEDADDADDKFGLTNKKLLDNIQDLKRELTLLEKKAGLDFSDELESLRQLDEALQKPFDSGAVTADHYKSILNDLKTIGERIRDSELSDAEKLIEKQKELKDITISEGVYSKSNEEVTGLIKEIDDLKKSTKAWGETYVDYLYRSGALQQYLIGQIRENTTGSKDLEQAIRNINKVYDSQLNIIQSVSGVYDDIYSSKSVGINLQIKALQSLRDEYIKLKDDALKSQDTKLGYEYRDMIIEIDKSIAKLGNSLDTIAIEKKFEPLKRFAQEFRTAASAGLGDIQSRWIDAAEKRNDLEEQLVLARKDLNEATVEGNQEMMLEAKKEIRALEDELNKVNSIVRTIGESLRDAFLQLADATFRNVMDDLAAQLTDILVATSKVGDVTQYAMPDLFKNASNQMYSSIKDAGGFASVEMKNALVAAGSIVAGQIAGSLVSDSVGGRQGAAIGSTFGAAAGTAGILGATGWAAGPIGGLLGGLAGAALGSLFGKDEEKPDDYVPVLEKNTDAVKANTKALEELSELVVNAPTNYRVPAFGGGYGGSVNLNFNGASSSEVRSALSILEEYGIDIRSTRTRARVVI